MARNTCPWSSPWSKTCTTLGWESLATECASLMKRWTKEGSWAREGCMTFKASLRSSLRSWATYTVAMPPPAILDSTK